MKRIVWAIGLLPCLSSQGLADFEAGREAFIRGDFKSAYQEFMRPATEGDAKSRIGLGLLHAHGFGVDRDLVQAHKWFDLASDENSAKHPVVRTLAKENRKFIAKQLSTEQIGEAKIQAAFIALEYAPEDTAGTSLEPSDGPTSVSAERRNGHAARLADGKSLPSTQAPETERRTTASNRTASAPSPSVRIQLVALRDGGKTARAMAEWDRLKRRHPTLLALQPVVSRVDLGNKGVFHRLRAGPFENLAKARHACRSLRAARQDCLVVED